MTLGIDTAALLTHTVHAMKHHLSADQCAISTFEDRRSVLANIKATIEVAAKLAEVAHIDAWTAHNAGEVANASARVARAEAGRAAAGEEKERVAAERMARIQAGAEKAGRDAGRALEEVEDLRVQVDRFNMEFELCW